MSIGESIQKGFGIAKKSMPLVLLLFVLGFIFNMINLKLSPASPDPNAPPSTILIVAGVIFIFMTIFLQAGSMGYVRDRLKTGSAAFANFTAAGGKYYLPILVLGIVVSLIIGVFVLLAALVVALLPNLQVVSVPLAILLAALGVYFLVMLFLSPYAVVVDDKTVRQAISLSMKLVKKNILPLLGISALLILIGFGIGLVLGAVLAGVGFVVKQENVSQVIFALLSSFVNAYLGIVVTGAFMSFYLSLSDRNNP